MQNDAEKYQIVKGPLKEYLPLTFVVTNGNPEEQLWDDLMRKWHYLGYDKMIGQRVKYLVYWQDIPISAISYNRASYRVGVRDEWLNWSEETRRDLLPHIVNNNRFLIMPWIQVKNLASYILAKTLHLLEYDWFRIYGIRPYAAETFVDASKYQGTCYKAANWRYLGETRGYSKEGKAFVYHGNRKSVYIYVINQKLFTEIANLSTRPFSTKERVRSWDMMLSIQDYNPNIFEEVGLNEETVGKLSEELTGYLDGYSSCFSRDAQQRNAEIMIKGLLSDLDRKSIEPIALRYADENAVRTLQQFLRDSPWDDAKMEQLYQDKVLASISDPNGMLTLDGSDFAKKGKDSAGVARQYCGSLGKIENCQAGVFIGYSGKDGYGLLNARLYLPEKWFEDSHKELRKKCGIPEDITFKTKPELANDMINEIKERRELPFKWIGCDSAFGANSEFRDNLPDSLYFFGDIKSNQLVYRERPEWIIPERKSKHGPAPTAPQPTIEATPVSVIASDDSIPWETMFIMEGSKGAVYAEVKCCRIIEYRNGQDGEALWLYMRKLEDGEIKYALSNAHSDTELPELNRAATLRWPIEQCFQECKSELGMDHYETRSYVAWHRHMLLVMVASLFVLQVRRKFVKKTKPARKPLF